MNRQRSRFRSGACDGRLEHAYLLDYKPAERPKYIEAFFSTLIGPWLRSACKKIVRSAALARDG